MPFPAQIAPFDGFGIKGYPCGPYDAGAQGLYAVLSNFDPGAGTVTIECFNSTDSGNTWTRTDQAGEVVIANTGNTQLVGSMFDAGGGLIHVGYDNAGTLAIVNFDTATNLWAAPIVGGPLLDFQSVTIRLAKRSTGPLGLIYGELDGIFFTTFCNFVEYNGGWGVPVVISSGAGQNDKPYDITSGAAGRLHIYTSENQFNGGALRHVSVDTLNALSAITVIAVNVEASGDGVMGQAFYDAGTNLLLVPGIGLIDTDLHIFTAGEAASPPAWTDTDAGFPTNPIQGFSHPQMVSSALVAGLSLQAYRTFLAAAWSIAGVGIGNIGGYVSPGTLFTISFGLVGGSPAVVFSEDPAVMGSFVATRTMFIGPTTAVIVPNVVGLPKATAITTITGVGLVPTVTIVSSLFPPGIVASQSPVGGSSVAPGSVVALAVSGGPPQITFVGVVRRGAGDVRPMQQVARLVKSIRKS